MVLGRPYERSDAAHGDAVAVGPATARQPTRESRSHGMKFSYVMLPDYPLTESLASIKQADELGFYAVYAADETWHKDLWLLFAAAADKTSQHPDGPERLRRRAA